MKSISNTQIDVLVNVDGVDQSIVRIGEVETMAVRVCDQISLAFDQSVERIQEAMLMLKELTTSVIRLTNEITSLTGAYREQGNTDLFFDIYSASTDTLSLLCDLYEGEKVRSVILGIANGIGNVSKNMSNVIGVSFGAAFAKISDAFFNPNHSLVAGIRDYMDAVENAAPECGKFAAMFPGLSMAISDAGQKFRDLGSAIGTAFSSFGTTIAQVASSTGTWIANTAAKVANTAAQWAQIAATTAWQAICTAATAVTTAFGAAMNFLTSPIGLVVLAVAALIAIIVALIANWDAVKEAAAKAWESITQTVEKVTNFLLEKLNGFNEFLQGAFAKDWTEQFGAFGSVLNAFFANFENVWNAVKGIFDGMIGFVKNIFAGNWGAAWESIVGVFKGIWDYLVAVVKVPINAIIGLINGLVQGVVDGINTVIGMLNNFKVEVPDWGIFGDYAGETLGFNIATIKAPQIPYLAQGAVLPANKPFLAMVGDQKHGTNVEAPLATIQEAVALVMEDMVASNMAGHEATVAALRQILQAVMGIRVGDEVLGRAVDRYHSKMAVIHGGM